MRLPDPFTPNLKVDLLPEINQPPRIVSDFTLTIQKDSLKDEVDSYLQSRQPVAFLRSLAGRFVLSAGDAKDRGTSFNVPLINSLVLYVGSQAIAQLQNKGPQASSPISHSAPMDIFQQLVTDLNSEGRFLFLNAIANQLRYPNNHTHYFSCVLLYLFAETPSENEIVQEQITRYTLLQVHLPLQSFSVSYTNPISIINRVLLERLIVNRPHPWGLLITFIELIKNPRYNFWRRNFTRCKSKILVFCFSFLPLFSLY
tara:strand:- start:1171 stop:1941 length:771 start_codon:yes stop_codon:yes gene_type:complete